jgi:hypothetical protein
MGIGGTRAEYAVAENEATGSNQFQAANGGFYSGNLNYAEAGPESILPAPTEFQLGLPLVSIIRPRTIRMAGAMVLVQKMIRSGLFQGQPAAFVNQLLALAAEADAATRQNYTPVF